MTSRPRDHLNSFWYAGFSFLTMVLAIVSVHHSSGVISAHQYGSIFNQLKQQFLVTLMTFAVLGWNFAWVGLKISRLFFPRNQGKKLEAILNRSGPKFTRYLVLLVSMVVTLILFHLFQRRLFYSSSFEILFSEIRALSSSHAANLIKTALSLNYALSFFPIMSFLCILIVKRSRRFDLSYLPRVKNCSDHIILGAQGEEELGGDLSAKPSWICLNKKALHGNILITGSIGSGKTSSTILPYFKQILSNFTVKPAVLAIDPKGTFIDACLTLINTHGLEHNLVHFSLSEKATFNPLYMERPLKNGGFLYLANMVKAANKNIMRGGGEPFWEMSAFNLVKNSIVFCAATKGYFTLKDLYRTMILAGGEGLLENLDIALDQGNFDEEEKQNIKYAKQYFELEFSSLDTKVKTGILATSTAFLNQFEEYQVAKIFCPTEDDPHRLSSMEEAIEAGKIILFTCENPAVARSMGVFFKLHFEQAVLNRLKKKDFKKCSRPALLIIDEYQDVVSTGHGAVLGDESYLAKGREANAISIFATQSVCSLENAVGKESACHELLQNLRTKIALHSSDLSTIRMISSLAGKKEISRESHSLSETSLKAKRNIIENEYESSSSNISEGVSITQDKEELISAKDFSTLNNFEAFGLIFDGVSSHFSKIYLKPIFLKSMRTAHKEVLRKAALVSSYIFCLGIGLNSSSSFAAEGVGFPTVCAGVNSKEYSQCLGYQQSGCMCGFPPRPCARFQYMVPVSMVEVVSQPKDTFFDKLPGAQAQLKALKANQPLSGVDDDNGSYFFHVHALPAPLQSLFSSMPCGGARGETTCFEAMSEHLGRQWRTGGYDRFQPQYLAWSLAPQACLMAGEISGSTSVVSTGRGSSSQACSAPTPILKATVPSNGPMCTSWGFMYPRAGEVQGTNRITASLLASERLRSLYAENLKTHPVFPGEKYQMLEPSTSSCFSPFSKSVAVPEMRGLSEFGRSMAGLSSIKRTGFLYLIWKPISCCRDVALVPAAEAAKAAIKLSCQGVRS